MSNYNKSMKELGKLAAGKAARDLEGFDRAIKILKDKKTKTRK